MLTKTPFWKKTPVFRLLLPFAAGILLQWYTTPPPPELAGAAAFSLLLLFSGLLPLSQRYRLRALSGLALQVLLLCAGAFWLQLRDAPSEPDWIGRAPKAVAVLVRLTAPLQEKTASWKAEAEIVQAHINGHWQPASGGALLYLRKDSDQHLPVYGQELLVQAPLEPIRGSGNPGAFDYSRWCLFRGITHTVFLRTGDYRILPGFHGTALQRALFTWNERLVATLQRYIPSGPAQGMAEALLIGYKNDLDKELVRTYSRTGVVHIIAISGMHLALVYALLLGFTWPLRANRFRWLRMALVLTGLWAFTALAGGGPSLLRAAVMFSFIAFGALIGRKGNGINTLLLAALTLLLLNPFWLWDIGFQLSFTAVGGILLFYRPVYQLYSPDNRLLDAIWKGSAVTLAAQVLTTPISLYHFHQFPLLFLFANILAVPLSALLVYALLALLGLSFWPAAATLLGKGIGWLIGLLNSYIASIDRVPMAVWEGISVSAMQTILLYGLIATLAWGPLQQRRPLWRPAMACLGLLLLLRSISFFTATRQSRLLVYNIPKHSALEVHEGRQLAFRGDAEVLEDPSLRSFHLDPAHVGYRLEASAVALPNAFLFADKVIVNVGEKSGYPPLKRADVLILSGRPHVFLPKILEAQMPSTVVLDASVSKRTAARWKSDCARAGVTCYDVTESGAFMLER
jgi:competence protein ComEC